MKSAWKRLAARIDAYSLRERAMIFAAAMFVLLSVVFTLFIEAEFAKQKQLAAGIAQKQSQARAFDDQIARLVTSRQHDPDQADRERLAQQRAELAQVEGRIGVEERKFTTPAQMHGVIRELLTRSRSVRLVEMKTLASSSIAEARAAGDRRAPGVERLIYRHGIEVTVSGSYLDLLAYLGELERLPTQLYWGSLTLSAAGYPAVTLKVTVYTLSLDRAWLSV